MWYLLLTVVVVIMLFTLQHVFRIHENDAMFQSLRVIALLLMASSAALGFAVYVATASPLALAVGGGMTASIVLLLLARLSAVGVIDAFPQIPRLSVFFEVPVIAPIVMIIIFQWHGFRSRLGAQKPISIIVIAIMTGITFHLLLSWLLQASLVLPPLVLRFLSLLIFGGLPLVAAFVFSRFYRLQPSEFTAGTVVFLVYTAFAICLDEAWGFWSGVRPEMVTLLHVLGLGAFIFGFCADSIASLSRTQHRQGLIVDPEQRDALTGIHNRRGLDILGPTIFERTLRAKKPVSILMLDLDHFKRVNDYYGHAAGDDVLRQFAQIIQANIRASDMTARYGGEEFTVVLPSAALAPAMRLAERIREQTENHEFLSQPHVLRMTVSIGVATAFPEEGHDFVTLLKEADHNLYRAKNEGRNRVLAKPVTIPEPLLEHEQ